MTMGAVGGILVVLKRPHRPGDQDATLSRWKQGFESPWGYQSSELRAYEWALSGPLVRHARFDWMANAQGRGQADTRSQPQRSTRQGPSTFRAQRRRVASGTAWLSAQPVGELCEPIGRATRQREGRSECPY